jgi:hypothetical protein
VQIKELNREYKRRFYEITDELGHFPDTKDKEYWELHEWYKSNVESATVTPVTTPVEVKRVEDKVVPGSQRLCRVCNKEMPKPTKRGRPPVMHDECRSK